MVSISTVQMTIVTELWLGGGWIGWKFFRSRGPADEGRIWRPDPGSRITQTPKFTYEIVSNRINVIFLFNCEFSLLFLFFGSNAVFIAIDCSNLNFIQFLRLFSKIFIFSYWNFLKKTAQLNICSNFTLWKPLAEICL